MSGRQSWREPLASNSISAPRRPLPDCFGIAACNLLTRRERADGTEECGWRRKVLFTLSPSDREKNGRGAMGKDFLRNG